VKNIIIYGFGGLGREIACLLNHINRVVPSWNLLGFIDDGVASGTECKYGKVLGARDTLNAWPEKVSVIIAIANPKLLEEISSSIVNPLVDFPNIVAPDVLFFDEKAVCMGHGNVITFGCRLSCNVSIGNFNLLVGQVTLSHDVVLGDYNVLFPETRISGMTGLGNGNFFGARCFAAQCLTIGSGNRFGAGSFILRKIRDGGAYFGNPCKKMSID